MPHEVRSSSSVPPLFSHFPIPNPDNIYAHIINFSPHTMSQGSSVRLLDNVDAPEDRQRPPGNVDYVMPYYGLFLLLYAFIGTFCCGGFSDSLSTSASAMLWTSYVVSYAVLILIHPKVCVEDKRLDEENREVLVRWPLVGFKACEVLADLERTRNGYMIKATGRV